MNVIESALKTWEAARGTRFRSVTTLAKKTGLSVGQVNYMIELLTPIGLMKHKVYQTIRYVGVGTFDREHFLESIGEEAEDELDERYVMEYSLTRENERKLAMLAARTNRGMSDTLADIIVSAFDNHERVP